MPYNGDSDAAMPCSSRQGFYGVIAMEVNELQHKYAPGRNNFRLSWCG
jgi:hypothetical protein